MKTYLKWHWAYQWELSFNPDIKIQAQEIIFSRKKNDTSHPSVKKTSWSLFS